MTMMQASNISYSVGEVPILRDIDLELKAGELLGLIGPNGAGKSTLLRIITGLLPEHGGSISVRGTPVNHMTQRQRAQTISYLAQQSVVSWPLKVERLVELGRLPHLDPWQKPSADDAAVIARVMQETDVTQLAWRTFNTLSGGERMRVLLARALVVEPAILLADEPVAALDPAHQLDVMALIRRHCDQGGSAVVVLHDLTLAAHFCDRLQLLHKGSTYAVGDPVEVLSPDNLDRVYQIRPRVAEKAFGNVAALAWERSL